MKEICGSNSSVSNVDDGHMTKTKRKWMNKICLRIYLNINKYVIEKINAIKSHCNLNNFYLTINTVIE